MAQLKNDEWPADNEPTTTETQDRDELRGQVPTAGEVSESDDDSELMNIRPDEAVD